MTNTTYNITAAEAREIALREACLDGAEFRSVTFEDGLWDVEFIARTPRPAPARGGSCASRRLSSPTRRGTTGL